MKAFIDIADEKLMNQAFIPYNMPKTYKILNPASQPHFSKARQWIAGKTFAEFEAIANWDTVKASMDWVEELIKLNEAEGFTGGYIIGDKFTYAEIFVGSKLYWWIVQGKDSQLWKDLVALNGGRWGRLIDHLEKLGKVDQIEWKP
jgi:glutathione S-transferase